MMSSVLVLQAKDLPEIDPLLAELRDEVKAAKTVGSKKSLKAPKPPKGEEPLKPRKRRTKAELLAEAAAKAKALLPPKPKLSVAERHFRMAARLEAAARANPVKDHSRSHGALLE
jgi:hypothetical protein